MHRCKIQDTTPEEKRLHGEEGGGAKAPTEDTSASETAPRRLSTGSSTHAPDTILAYLDSHPATLARISRRLEARADVDDFRQEVRCRLLRHPPPLTVPIEAAVRVVVRSTLADFLRLIYRQRSIRLAATLVAAVEVGR